MMNLVSLRQSVLKVIADAFGKQFDRSQIEDGVKHAVTATVSVSGTIDGASFKFNLPVDAKLTVGHATTRANSWTPSTERQLAYVLELIDLAYGPKAVRDITDDLLAKFKESKDIPASDDYLDLVEEMSRNMRIEDQVDVNGSVSVKHASKEAVSVKFEAA